MSEDNKSLDIFGIKPFAKSVEKLTDGAINAASAFLGRVCNPAAEEFGLLLQDKVRQWRGANSVKIINKAEQKLLNRGHISNMRAHPRLVWSILENGSWIEDDDMQNMWAGLLASSCTENNLDESNLLFINILSQLSSVQARILSYCCENAKVRKSEVGWISTSGSLGLPLEKLKEISQMDDVHRIDRELDHLNALALIGYNIGRGGFLIQNTTADVTPTPLTLQLYVRCQGYIGSPIEYFNL